MKKIKYIILILFVFILVGCKKNTITIDEFIDVAKFNGYIVENDKSGYETYDYIKDIYYAVNRLNAYYVQLIELDSDENAKKFFLTNVDDIREDITTEDYLKSKSLSNYELFHAENEDAYYLIIRNKNFIIYVVAPINYINEIEEFLDELSLEY